MQRTTTSGERPDPLSLTSRSAHPSPPMELGSMARTMPSGGPVPPTAPIRFRTRAQERAPRLALTSCRRVDPERNHDRQGLGQSRCEPPRRCRSGSACIRDFRRSRHVAPAIERPSDSSLRRPRLSTRPRRRHSGAEALPPGSPHSSPSTEAARSRRWSCCLPRIRRRRWSGRRSPRRQSSLSDRSR